MHKKVASRSRRSKGKMGAVIIRPVGLKGRGRQKGGYGPVISWAKGIIVQLHVWYASRLACVQHMALVSSNYRHHTPRRGGTPAWVEGDLVG